MAVPWWILLVQPIYKYPRPVAETHAQFYSVGLSFPTGRTNTWSRFCRCRSRLWMYSHMVNHDSLRFYSAPHHTCQRTGRAATDIPEPSVCLAPTQLSSVHGKWRFRALRWKPIFFFESEDGCFRRRERTNDLGSSTTCCYIQIVLCLVIGNCFIAEMKLRCVCVCPTSETIC